MLADKKSASTYFARCMFSLTKTGLPFKSYRITLWLSQNFECAVASKHNDIGGSGRVAVVLPLAHHIVRALYYFFRNFSKHFRGRCAAHIGAGRHNGLAKGSAQLVGELLVGHTDA